MKMANNPRVYPIVVERDEDGMFVATNTSLPGCYSQGKSIEEALTNVQEATELLLENSDVNEEAMLDRQVSVHLITA